MTPIEVTTGARLHFGLLCGKPESAWHYGGVGMMIDAPAWHLRLALTDENSKDEIIASAPATLRIAQVLADFRRLQRDIGPISCCVMQEMDFHSGLGSGTQLTLAIAAALSVLAGEPRSSDIECIAKRLGRSQRSAIGTFGFDHGGFIIDRGKNSTHATAQQRIRFPEAWRIVLITPTSNQGLSGPQEETFFEGSEFLDETTLHAITDVVKTGIIPALKREDDVQFSASLANYGQLIGEYYASQQGGIFSSPLIRELAEWLKSEGLPLPVQSSWGPTVCIPVASAERAHALADAVSNRIIGAQSASITIARGLNTGATLKSFAPEDHRSFG